MIDNSIQFGVTMLDWGQSASKRGECVGVHWDPDILKRPQFHFREGKIFRKIKKQFLNSVNRDLGK